MKNKKGFTIVELVIVIAVIAILAAVLIPTFSTVIAKANQSNAQQTATNALKAGLLMTNTAQLPANTFVLVDSDKNYTTDADYGFQYKNGNELEQVTILGNDKKFLTSTLLPSSGYTILIGEDFATFNAATTEPVAAASATAGGNAELILTMLKFANNASVNYTIGVVTNSDGTLKNYTIMNGESKVCDVYTSVDMPKNVIVFVPQN